METLETAAPVGTTIKRFSDPKSSFKLCIEDLIKSFTMTCFPLDYSFYHIHCIVYLMTDICSNSQIGYGFTEKTTFNIFYCRVVDCC